MDSIWLLYGYYMDSNNMDNVWIIYGYYMNNIYGYYMDNSWVNYNKSLASMKAIEGDDSPMKTMIPSEGEQEKSL